MILCFFETLHTFGVLPTQTVWSACDDCRSVNISPVQRVLTVPDPVCLLITGIREKA